MDSSFLFANDARCVMRIQKEVVNYGTNNIRLGR